MSEQLARNLELKARCPDPARVAEVVKQLGARLEWTKRQVDTYFHVRQGRLKLREQDGKPAELIAYHRANETDVRASDYEIVIVPDPAALTSALTRTLGVRVIVAKRRTLYLWHNVRIHLDEVERLGSFLEFEAVISPEHSEPVSSERLDRLRDALQINADDLVAVSYSDLLERAGA